MATILVIVSVLARTVIGVVFVVIGRRHMQTLRYERVWRKAKGMNGTGDRYLRDRITHCRNLVEILAFVAIGSAVSLPRIWTRTFEWWQVIASASLLWVVLRICQIIWGYLQQRNDLYAQANRELPAGTPPDEIDPYANVGHDQVDEVAQ